MAPVALRYKHVKPYRELLGLTQQQLATELHLGSHASVSTWENDPQQEHLLPDEIQRKLGEHMKDNGHMVMSDYTQNMGGRQEGFQVLVESFNAFVAENRVNEIDRVALYHWAMKEPRGALCAASTVQPATGKGTAARIVPDDVLEKILGSILSVDNAKYSDFEAPILFHHTQFAYIKRKFIDTPYGLLVVCANKSLLGAFNTGYFSVQSKMGTEFRRVMREMGVIADETLRLEA